MFHASILTDKFSVDQKAVGIHRYLSLIPSQGTILLSIATVLELVDKHDLESCGASHVGSIPTRGTSYSSSCKMT